MAEKVGEIYFDVTLETAAALNSAHDFRKEVNATEKSLSSFDAKLSATAKAVQGFVASLAIAAAVQKVIAETRNAEQEQAQLAAVLKSTGESAGWTAEKLNEMADAMERNSTFSAGEITQAQTRLLSYTNIVGTRVPEAMQATIDMAARLNMSMTQSAETIGRALDKPSEGMQTLRRQGFKFGEDQIALAKKLEVTGRTAEAQAMVLAELSSAYGGAALAARNTFGGAISALQNQLNSLLTADGASLGSATQAVNDLAEVLGSSQTKAAFDAITGWVVSFARVLVTATTNIVGFLNSSEKIALLTGTDKFTRAKTDAERYGREVTNLTNKAIQMQEEIEFISKDLLGEGKDPRQDETIKQKTAALDRLRSRIGEVQEKAQGAAQALKVLANGASPLEPATTPEASKNRPAVPNAAGAKAAADAEAKARKKAEQERERQAEQAKQYLKTLDEQLVKTQDLTEYEKLMLDVKKGNVHLSADQLAKAQGLATAIDMVKDLEEKRQAVLNLQNAELSAQRDLMAQIDAYNQANSAMTMSDRAAQDMANRLQITQTYLNRIRDLEDQQRTALASSDPSKEASIRKQYEAQIAVQQEYQVRALAEYDKYILARNAKEGDWVTGAQKAYANYLESASNAANQAQSLFEKGFQSMEDALTSFAMTGKLNFKNMAESIIADLIRIQVRASMVQALGGNLGGGLFSSLVSSAASLFGGSGSQVAGAVTTAVSGWGNVTGTALPALAGGRANGGDVSAGKMYEVNERGVPELLTVGNKQLLMMAGQSGNVTPLDTGRMNAAAVPSTEGGAPNVEVRFEVNNYSSAKVQQRQETQTMPNGDVMKKFVLEVVGDSFMSGQGSAYRGAKQRFGLRD